MALYCRCLFAFAFLGRLLIKFTTTQLGQDACFLTGTFEPAQRGVKILILFNANTRHTYNLGSDIKKPGTKAGT